MRREHVSVPLTTPRHRARPWIDAAPNSLPAGSYQSLLETNKPNRPSSVNFRMTLRSVLRSGCHRPPSTCASGSSGLMTLQVQKSHVHVSSRLRSRWAERFEDVFFRVSGFRDFSPEIRARRAEGYRGDPPGIVNEQVGELARDPVSFICRAPRCVGCRVVSFGKHLEHLLVLVAFRRAERVGVLVFRQQPLSPVHVVLSDSSVGEFPLHPLHLHVRDRIAGTRPGEGVFVGSAPRSPPRRTTAPLARRCVQPCGACSRLRATWNTHRG